MQYKTIVLEMIEQRPAWHKTLMSSNALLSTLNHYAPLLRENHLELIQRLQVKRPEAAEMQIASEAMEIAISQLEEVLPPSEELNENSQQESAELTLDEAMTFLQRSQTG